jgi:hypothetical protein
MAKSDLSNAGTATTPGSSAGTASTPPNQGTVTDLQALKDVTGDRETKPAVHTPMGVGSVSGDHSSRVTRLPLFKVRHPLSKCKDPSVTMGAATLDLETMTADKEGNTKLVVLSYWQGFENVRPMGSNLPEILWNSVAEVKAAGQKLAYPPKGYEDIRAADPKAATARECGRAVILIRKPDDLQSMSFPFTIDGKQYALARWFLTGHNVWICGNTILDKADLELRNVGIMAASWIFRTFQDKNRAGQEFYKPQFFMDRTGMNSKEFIEAATKLFSVNKEEASRTDDMDE